MQSQEKVDKILYTYNGVPPTFAQTKFIGRMVKRLGLPKPNIKTRRGASRWINQHIDEYHEDKMHDDLLRECEMEARGW